MHDKLFEAALGISAPWSVKSVEFDAEAKLLTVLFDFAVRAPASAWPGLPACIRFMTPWPRTIGT
jgi:hypothetical protein